MIWSTVVAPHYMNQCIQIIFWPGLQFPPVAVCLKCLRFGLWLTPCTLKDFIYLLTFQLHRLIWHVIICLDLNIFLSSNWTHRHTSSNSSHSYELSCTIMYFVLHYIVNKAVFVWGWGFDFRMKRDPWGPKSLHKNSWQRSVVWELRYLYCY